MHFEDWMELVVKGFEVAGVVILAVGSLAALTNATIALSRGDRRVAYAEARRNVGRAVLLGLEVLIIADIVQTITIDPTAESALILGTIVLVRTFLSFSLEIELGGVVPGAALRQLADSPNRRRRVRRFRSERRRVPVPKQELHPAATMRLEIRGR